MKNSILLSLFCLFLFCLACNKDKLPISKNNPITLNNFEEDLKQKLIARLGNYTVNCRVKTTDVIPDSLYGYLEVRVDSFFMDTLILGFLEASLVYAGYVPTYSFPEGTIFVSAKLLEREYPSNFFLQLKDNTVEYKSTEDSYMCKCGGLLRLERDTIYYRYFNGGSSFDISVECNGTKIN